MLEFRRDGGLWIASVRLPSWAGFQARRGGYGALSSDDPSDGSVEIMFESDESDLEVCDGDKALIQWFLDNEAAVAQSAMIGLIAEYPRLQELYDYEGQDRENLMPDVSSTEDFRTLIGLQCVHIHAVQKNGVPYIGFEFGCAWDNEHGLGIMTNGTRVVEVGGADTAILFWIAKKDAE